MRRKIILSILSILILLCSVCLIYEKINKDKTNTGMFAIYLEKEKNTGKYEKSNLKTWPTDEDYAINMQKTYCENGSILRWNLETKKINVTVKGTDKCYVYFDKAKYGTEQHPHLIQTIEDLVRLSNDVNSGITYAGEYFLLTNDLDFKDPSDYEDANRTDFLDINGINGNEPLITELTTGSCFVPIGNSETNSFQGNFDGGNKRIDNLYINDSTIVNSSIGFFGFAKNTNISDLTISGNIHDSQNPIVGGIIGQALGTNKLVNLNNNITILYECKQSINYNSTGGIIGGNNGDTVLINCHNFANITIQLFTAGGLVGQSDYNSSLIIESCYNKGDISSIGTSASVTGGLIGHVGASDILINKSYNEGNIYSNCYASGLIGTTYNNPKDLHDIYILNSYNGGNVEVSKATYATYGAQGFILSQHGNLYIFNCYNQGKMTTKLGNSRGLIWSFNDEAITMFNVYNSSNENYALGNFTSPENDIVEHAYYIPGENILGSNVNFGTPIAKNIMQSQAFVDELNQNIEGINLEQINPLLKNYKLSKWELGDNGYPTLINE